jgi:hypothetical protein
LSNVEVVADMMAEDGYVYLKSEFAQPSRLWPLAGFGKRAGARHCQNTFKWGRDVIISVGTLSPDTTPNPAHRSRLLTAYTVEPKLIKETYNVLERWVYDQVILDQGRDRWPWCVPALTMALMQDKPAYPSVYDYCPNAYSQLSDVRTRGLLMPVTGPERLAIMGLPVVWEPLTLHADVIAFQNLRNPGGGWR